MMADISQIIAPTLSLAERLDEVRRKAAAARLAATRNPSQTSITTNEISFVSSSSCSLSHPSSDNDDAIPLSKRRKRANPGPSTHALSPITGDSSTPPGVDVVAHQLKSLLSEKRRGFFQPLAEAIRDSKRDHLEGILLHLCIQFPDARAVAESLLTADENVAADNKQRSLSKTSGSPITADHELSITQLADNRKLITNKSNVENTITLHHKSFGAQSEKVKNIPKKPSGSKPPSNVLDQGVLSDTAGIEKRKRESSPDKLPTKQKEPYVS
jgi:hypothetical protein